MVKSLVKSLVKNMVYGESNEINGKKNYFEFYRGEKNCLLLIRSEKIVRLSWESKKKFDPEGKTIAPPPTYQMVRPLGLLSF